MFSWFPHILYHTCQQASNVCFLLISRDRPLLASLPLKFFSKVESSKHRTGCQFTWVKKQTPHNGQSYTLNSDSIKSTQFLESNNLFLHFLWTVSQILSSKNFIYSFLCPEHSLWHIHLNSFFISVVFLTKYLSHSFPYQTMSYKITNTLTLHFPKKQYFSINYYFWHTVHFLNLILFFQWSKINCLL